jgi:hypothetical protein
VKRHAYKVIEGKFEGQRPLGRPSHEYEDDMKRIINKQVVSVWSGLNWLRIGSNCGLFYGKRPSGSIKDGEFLI